MQPSWNFIEANEIARTSELYSLGESRDSLARAVADREILRVRKGWYSLPGLDPDLQRAARVGGRLTAGSAAAKHGVWVADPTTLHVAVAADATQLRTPASMAKRLREFPVSDLAVHWSDDKSGGTRTQRDLSSSLIDLAATSSPDYAAASLESALNRGLLLPRNAAAVLAALPRSRRQAIGALDERAEAGTETLVRRDLVRAGLDPEVQVWIPGVGRIDLKIRRLLIEIDGFAHHGGREAFERDRMRDGTAAADGYRSLRFSYRQCMFERPWVVGIVLACIARGEHL